MTKLKLFWLDLVESESHDNQLTLLDLSAASKVMLKISWSTLTLLCLWWSVLTTSVIHWFSISRDQKNELYPIPKYTLCWRRKPLPSRCILLFSVGWSTAALFIHINCDQKYRLQKVQNRAAKALFRKSRHEHVRSCTAQGTSVAASQRKDYFQGSQLCFLCLWWYPATIPVTTSLCIRSSPCPFQLK